VGGDLAGGGVLPGFGDADLVLEFEDDALGGFLADALQFREGRNVTRDDGFLELGDIHAAEHGNGHGGAYSTDAVDEQQEDISLLLTGEAEEFLAELAEMEVCAEIDGESLRGVEAVEGGKGNEHLVADALDVHHQAVRIGFDDLATESRDHAGELGGGDGRVNVNPWCGRGKDFVTGARQRAWIEGVDFRGHEINRDWTAEAKIDLCRQMVRIRKFETTTLKYYQGGKMGGWLFLGVGQEMIAAVVRSLMGPGDHSMSGTRGMRHAIAAGMAMGPCMAELYGKSNGSSKGKGGALSFFGPERNFWGCHGLAAAQTPLALGLAYAVKYQEKPGVVFCFLGDGSVNQGVYHESLNLAALFGLPVIYVIENNGFGWGTSVAKSSCFKGCLARRAEGYAIDWDCFDDGDPFEMRARLWPAIRRAREEGKPTVIEISTYRYYGASVADSRHKGGYRTAAEIEERKKRDPLLLWERHLMETGLLDDAAAQSIRRDALAEAMDAVQFAEDGRVPTVAEVSEDVYWETDHGTPASKVGRHFFDD